MQRVSGPIKQPDTEQKQQLTSNTATQVGKAGKWMMKLVLVTLQGRLQKHEDVVYSISTRVIFLLEKQKFWRVSTPHVSTEQSPVQ